MKSRLLCLLGVLLWVSVSSDAVAQEAAKPASFAQAVVDKAIAFMPDDLKTKLAAVRKEIVAGAVSVAYPSQGNLEPVYFVEKGEGLGPYLLAEQFRLARKGVGDKASYPAMASRLGGLAGCVISMSQPYRSDETAFGSPARREFEQRLNEAFASLKAEFDGYHKVDNPAEFGIGIAKQANAQLKKLKSAGSEGEPEVRSAVFVLAANSLADCWWTLLGSQTQQAQARAQPDEKPREQSPAVANYIGNKRSLKFHLPTCRYQPAEQNRVYYKTREEAIRDGYVPCKVCKP